MMKRFGDWVRSGDCVAAIGIATATVVRSRTQARSHGRPARAHVIQRRMAKQLRARSARGSRPARRDRPRRRRIRSAPSNVGAMRRTRTAEGRTRSPHVKASGKGCERRLLLFGGSSVAVQECRRHQTGQISRCAAISDASTMDAAPARRRMDRGEAAPLDDGWRRAEMAGRSIAPPWRGRPASWTSCSARDRERTSRPNEYGEPEGAERLVPARLRAPLATFYFRYPTPPRRAFGRMDKTCQRRCRPAQR